MGNRKLEPKDPHYETRTKEKRVSRPPVQRYSHKDSQKLGRSIRRQLDLPRGGCNEEKINGHVHTKTNRGPPSAANK